MEEIIEVSRRDKDKEVGRRDEDEEAGRRDQIPEGVGSDRLCTELKLVDGASSTAAMNHGNTLWMGVYQLIEHEEGKCSNSSVVMCQWTLGACLGDKPQ